MKFNEINFRTVKLTIKSSNDLISYLLINQFIHKNTPLLFIFTFFVRENKRKIFKTIEIMKN